MRRKKSNDETLKLCIFCRLVVRLESRLKQVSVRIKSFIKLNGLLQV